MEHEALLGDRAERDDLTRFIDDEPEIVEVVPDAVIVQQRRHGQRVEVQGGVGVTTGSLNAAVTSDASQCS